MKRKWLTIVLIIIGSLGLYTGIIIILANNFIDRPLDEFIVSKREIISGMSPEKVAKSFMLACDKGDIGTALKYSSENFKRIIGDNPVVSNEEYNQFESIEIISSQYFGSETSIITLKLHLKNPPSSNQTDIILGLRLIRENREWKVNEIVLD